MYSLIHYESRIFFVDLDMNSGTNNWGVYATPTSMTCSKVISLINNSNKFYLVFQCDTHYVVVHDQITPTLKETYKGTDPSIHLNEFIVNIGKAYMAGYWNPAGIRGYIGRVSSSNMTSSPYIEKLAGSLFSNAAGYTITTSTSPGKFVLELNRIVLIPHTFLTKMVKSMVFLSF